MAYPPESDQNIYVDNAQGAVELVTSLKLYITRPGSSVEEEIGVAMSADVAESRDVNYNYVIGNGTDPGTPRDIIPGVMRSSTISLQALALYTKNILATLGAADGTRWLSSLRYQTRPFKIKEQVIHPNASTIRTIVYEGCMIESYSKTQDITRSDIRILENVTVHFKKVSVTTDNITSDN